MQHRVYGPLLFQLFDGKPFEEFLLSLEIGFQGGYEQTLSEAARAAEEVVASSCYQPVDKCGLVNIEIPVVAKFLKILYADRINILAHSH